MKKVGEVGLILGGKVRYADMGTFLPEVHMR